MATPQSGSLRLPIPSFPALAMLLAWCGVAAAQDAAPATQPAAVAPPTAESKPEPTPDDQVEPGEEVEVTMRDGRRISGLFVAKNPQQITLSISGIATPFPLESVERWRVLPGVDVRYAELRAAIEDDDTEQLLQLAEWLRSRGRLDLALWELDHVLEQEPANARAQELRTWVLEQQKVVDARRAARAGQGRPEEDDSGFPLLDEAQINLIRVFEVDIKNPPRMIVPRAAVVKFLDTYAGRTAEGKGTVPATPEGRELFMRQRPADLLGWFFALRARELYGMVQVLDNPPSLRIFRDEINRSWLTNSCATNKCHGGEEAGRLLLFNRKSGSDASAYTNFLILDRFKTSDGLGLIDYPEPARSPLLEMGLPHDQAIFKHPQVDSVSQGRWRPVFRDRNDEKFLRAVEWIRGMYPQRTGYPIDYKPPSPKAASPDVPQPR